MTETKDRNSQDNNIDSKLDNNIDELTNSSPKQNYFDSMVDSTRIKEKRINIFTSNSNDATQFRGPKQHSTLENISNLSKTVLRPLVDEKNVSINLNSKIKTKKNNLNHHEFLSDIQDVDDYGVLKERFILV